MMTDEQIKTIAIRLQTSELNTRREYLEHLFLAYFYQQPHASNIFFKGGTALRVIYGSPRFSEDLDFGSPLQDIHEIETAVLHTVQAIEKEGIQIDIKESTPTSGGYLAIITFQLGEQQVDIQLEISFRDKDVTGEVATVHNDFIPTYTVVGISQPQLVKGKLNALQTREKPRDYYDLYFMLRANMLTPEDRQILPQVLQKLKLTKLNFENELKNFLPKSHWLVIRDFNKTVEREIQRFV